MYDLVAVRCLDKNEKSLPNVGFLQLQDIETGQNVLLRTAGQRGSALHSFLTERLYKQESIFKKCGVDYVDISPEKSFIGDVILFFRRRMMY